jgi:2-polyprenyl-3-methyl-5-hydroxy-6-metoxy-1,4-benzoquinol methylase
MFVETVIAQAVYRRFHRHVDDALLDRCAAECGCAPIGRMCLLDDAAVAVIAERCKLREAKSVLDFGCGRGVFGRWLTLHGIEAQYAGIDRDEGAVAAARLHIPYGIVTRGDFRTAPVQEAYDAVVAIEIAVDGAIDDSVLDAAARALAPHGTLAVTIASVDGAQAGRLQALEAAARQRFADVEMVDWSESVRPFTQRMFEWWLTAPWPAEITEKNTHEARAVLGALAQDRFHYAVLFARA